MQEASGVFVDAEEVFDPRITSRGVSWESLEAMASEDLFDQFDVAFVEQEIEVGTPLQPRDEVLIALELAVANTTPTEVTEEPQCGRGGFRHADIPVRNGRSGGESRGLLHAVHGAGARAPLARDHLLRDRKSTRLNSSHVKISYAVFCL